MSRTGRPFSAALWVLGCVVLATAPGLARAQPLRPLPPSPAFPGLTPAVDAVRKASVAWERRPGPERQVVDQVCLVPDLPTFLEVIATWDESHYFPVLIDDVEFSFKFLRAFRPARIVRRPKKAEPVAADKVWEAAVAAVGRSWASESTPTAETLRGDQVPKRFGPTPPGVVVSAPGSPTLAGAAALAAGRFQPLVRWDVSKRYADVVAEAEGLELAAQLERKIAETVPQYGQLGDDCDFITLAGDWPYRYNTKEGANAFDDLIGRSRATRARWAYAGRLNGDLASSVYQTMCSLFLYPRSALLFNKYSERDRPWSDYSMARASSRLGEILPVNHRSGTSSNVTGWHSVFDPKNRYGLVLINSHGEPTRFHLTDGVAQTADVPPSVPAVVLMIHSYSAADPANAETIAGRWLANGAYVYFGAVNEPYLNAFHPPQVLAELIAEHVPLSAALRQSPPEPFGKPWRLLYLGDPLCRIMPDRKVAARADRWAPVAEWPAYDEVHEPEAGASDDLRLNWVLKSALYRLQFGTKPRVKTELAKVLLGIARDRVSERFRPLYDDLLIDALIEANRPNDLLARLRAMPAADRSPTVRRFIETLEVARLQSFLAANDFTQALGVWGEIIHSQAPTDLQDVVTERVGAQANVKGRSTDWRKQLLAAGRDLKNTPKMPFIDRELKRVDQKIKESKPR